MALALLSFFDTQDLIRLRVKKESSRGHGRLSEGRGPDACEFRTNAAPLSFNTIERRFQKDLRCK